MGIQGLLPFLEKSSKKVNIKEFSGCTVAIDAYCWLHKGAFACSDKLIMNEPTTVYVNYCMKYVNMLLSYNIKPILVFDGQHLAAKGDTEKKRRESREINKKKGAELLRAGRKDEARQVLRRAVDVTHEMALNVMKECRRRNVDCIVAPYEADAQLAYLNIKDIAHVIITEDSDLMLFGSKKVMFKMDINGNGILIERELLYLSMGIRCDLFQDDKFRYMCIISGCDYLPSLPGIGLAKACKFIKCTSDPDIINSLRKLPANLNMWSLVVTDEYRQKFKEADDAFLYQLVYDPLKRRQVPLHEPPSPDHIVGKYLPEDVAYQLALGNLNPFTKEKMDSFDPDKNTTQVAANRNSWVSAVAPHRSIWSGNYVPTVLKKKDPKQVLRPTTNNLSVTVDNSDYFKKRKNEDCEEQEDQLLSMYSSTPSKKNRLDIEIPPESVIIPPSPSPPELSSDSPSKLDASSDLSPVLTKKLHKNPFKIKRTSVAAPRCSASALVAFDNSGTAVSSRYFQSESSQNVTLHSNESQISNIDSGYTSQLSQEDCMNSQQENEFQTELDFNKTISTHVSEITLDHEEDQPRKRTTYNHSNLPKKVSTIPNKTPQKFSQVGQKVKKSSVKLVSGQTLLSKFGFQPKPRVPGLSAKR